MIGKTESPAIGLTTKRGGDMAMVTGRIGVKRTSHLLFKSSTVRDGCRAAR